MIIALPKPVKERRLPDLHWPYIRPLWDGWSLILLILEMEMN